MADATAGQAVAVDEGLGDFDDHDSALGSSSSGYSDTTTVASWLRDYREENGRTYHAYKDGAYFQPNDDRAQENLDIAHHLFLKTFDDKLFLAPVSTTLHNVLDIGTGTGLWAIDLADEHPEIQVTGTDLSPIQPSWVPPNCKFEIDDADTANWTWPENSFDFIHVRSLFGCITSWPVFYNECLRVLKPGGWIEQSEFSPGFTSDDGTVTKDTTMGQWGVLGKQVFDIMGKDIMIFQTMKDEIARAGFEAVEERKFKWPIGSWPKNPRLKDIGRWSGAHLNAGLEGWSMRALTTFLGWTPEEVIAFCASMRADMNNRKIHGIHEMTTVFGRKPSQ